MNWKYTHTLKQGNQHIARFDTDEGHRAVIGVGNTPELALIEVKKRVMRSDSSAIFLTSNEAVV